MTPPLFQIQERQEDDHVAISLIGELDLLDAPSVEDRLDELAAAKQPARLDLSLLEFIDSTGIRVLIRALLNAREDGWQLDVAPHLTPHVSRVLKLVQVDHLLIRPAAAPLTQLRAGNQSAQRQTSRELQSAAPSSTP